MVKSYSAVRRLWRGGLLCHGRPSQTQRQQQREAEGSHVGEQSSGRLRGPRGKVEAGGGLSLCGVFVYPRRRADQGCSYRDEGEQREGEAGESIRAGLTYWSHVPHSDTRAVSGRAQDIGQAIDSAKLADVDGIGLGVPHVLRCGSVVDSREICRPGDGKHGRHGGRAQLGGAGRRGQGRLVGMRPGRASEQQATCARDQGTAVRVERTGRTSERGGRLQR
jgi:hypothetical protein